MNVLIYLRVFSVIQLPWWLSGKESACNAGDTGDVGSIPGSGRSLGRGDGNSLQHSCLKNCMDRGSWQATVHRVAKSWTRLKWLITHAFLIIDWLFSH